MQLKRSVVSGRAGGTLIKGEMHQEYREGLFPGFSASGQDVWVDTPEYHVPGLVLSAVGARCGKCFKADGNWTAIANTHVLLPRPGFVRDYLFYVFNREEFWEKGGTAQPYVRVPASLSRPWAFPSPDEQRAIADFLDRETEAIESLIAAKRSLLLVLAEQRKAIIAAAVISGIEQNVRRRYSGIPWLGEIPEHWSTKRAKWLFQERDERSVTGDEVLLSLRQEQGLVRHNDVSEKQSRPEELVGYKKVSVGEIVINRMRASTGLVAIAFEDGLVSPDYAVFRVNPAADAEFYTLLFKTELLQAVFRSRSTGLGTGSSGFLRLYSENFLSLWLPYPSLPEQRAIVSQLRRRTSTIDSLVATTERSIALLKERRSSLISAAVTGQIHVRTYRPQEAAVLCQ